jgi:hypothetical protein
MSFSSIDMQAGRIEECDGSETTFVNHIGRMAGQEALLCGDYHHSQTMQGLD